MKIAHIDIQNFRKLKSCRVELAETNTILVGANNSGKTSAMDALIMFLKKSKRKELSTTDITLSNWGSIEQIGIDWASIDEDQQPDLTRDGWRKQLPSIDVWLEVDESEIHYVSHLLPTLDWDGGLLGARLILEPKDPEELYKAYISARTAAQKTLAIRKTRNDNNNSPSLALWPTSMRDFLDRSLQSYFTINAYVLDSSLANRQPQPFTEYMEEMDSDPFDGLFKIDIINAQRGFSDPNSGEGAANSDRRLSAQLRSYFDKHLNPNELPEESDLDALEAMEAARIAFDEKLKSSFRNAIGELEGLNYPGFSDPQIILSSKINPLEGLNHDSAVQFNVLRDDATSTEGFCLPEKYNGLGYQNLISMIFNLIRFRDEWMRVGKASKREENSSKPIEPIHLMLIEEPEAHLHAQVQQVFIKKAYSVLRAHSDLGDTKKFSTQMVVSTHSSHITHETDFTGLRYFRRNHIATLREVPSASVVNMSTIFGIERKRLANEQDPEEQKRIETAQFATRYLRTTHCDLFFADAAILIEGPAERMLVPHFIRNRYPELDRSYISLLEIGGSHAHRLRPLIEALGIPVLIITDLDSLEKEATGEKDANGDPKFKTKKARPKKNKNQLTGNDTLKTWAPGKTDLDEVLEVSSKQKIANCGKVRVAYPSITTISFVSSEEEHLKTPESAIPYTFEDALVLANIPIFRAMTDVTGLTRKMADSTKKSTLEDACDTMFDALNKSAKKAEMALDLLYSADPIELMPPHYIEEGLLWLKRTLEELSKSPLTQEV
ncbi:AAA family ATPase [Aeromonas dhakensis]|uniref:ATP-dependent nuclease n=1 Tax=Aeromonas dhakensis TaxID=196024 RepID=UPI001AAE2774|nr:AAA family ATPase [Aeromonas dhakensis]MBO2902712.1 AAA family ATPase [Aeromonas dhakensis]MBO2997530.1 AAA family ATPase [Aeromonas dhakensis]